MYDCTRFVFDMWTHHDRIFVALTAVFYSLLLRFTTFEREILYYETKIDHLKGPLRDKNTSSWKIWSRNTYLWKKRFKTHAHRPKLRNAYVIGQIKTVKELIKTMKKIIKTRQHMIALLTFVASSTDLNSRKAKFLSPFTCAAITGSPSA